MNTFTIWLERTDGKVLYIEIRFFFSQKKSDSLGPKLTARAFMGFFGGTSWAATLNYDETCKLLCAFVHNNFRNSPGLAFYRITKARRIQLRFLCGGKEAISETVSQCILPPQKGHPWNCFTVHSSGFSRGKIASGTFSSFSFTFSCFFLSIPPSVLLFWAVFTPLKHSTPLSAMFVYIRVPPNNLINERAYFGSQVITLFRSELLWYYFLGNRNKYHVAMTSK